MPTLESRKIKLAQHILSLSEETLLKEIESLVDHSHYELTQEDVQELDRRRKRHINGESKSYSWSEVKDNARSSI